MSAWGDYLTASSARIIERRTDRVRRGIESVRLREQYELMPATVEARLPGRQRVLAFERCRAELLNAVAREDKKRLSHDQKRLLDEMRNAMLLRMYGGNEKAFLADVPWLRATLGVAEIRDTVAVIYPRRQGKTLTQTLCAAIIALSQPGGNVMDFNPHQDQAKTWLAQTVHWLELLKNHAEFRWREFAHTESRSMVLYANGAGGSKNSIIVYGNGTNARNAQNLRGTGNDAMLINLDEGFFIVDEAWEVILPTIANGAALVVTSSMPAAQTSALDMLNARYPNGRLVFRTLDWRHACNDCRAKEARLHREIVCTHIQRKPPAHFRSGTDALRLKSLMAALGDSYARELQNMPSRAIAEPLFDADKVDLCIGPAAVRTIEALGEVTHFFVGVDPGSAHARSDTAIVSVAFFSALPGLPTLAAPIPLAGYAVILAAEAVAPQTMTEAAEMVRNQIAQVRLLPGMERARAIIACEANLPFLADDLYMQLREKYGVPNMLLIHLDTLFHRGTKHRADGTPANAQGETMPGVRTSQQNKPIIMDELARFFAEERVLRHAGMVTYATRNADREERLLYEAHMDEALLEATHRDAVAQAAATRQAVSRHTPVLDTRTVHRLGGRHTPSGPQHTGAAAPAHRLDPVYAAEARVRMINALAQQCKNMKRYTTHKAKRASTATPGADNTVTIVTYSGKERATAGRPECKDDLVMAWGMIVLGARAFYRLPDFEGERHAANIAPVASL